MIIKIYHVLNLLMSSLLAEASLCLMSNVFFTNLLKNLKFWHFYHQISCKLFLSRLKLAVYLIYSCDKLLWYFYRNISHNIVKNSKNTAMFLFSKFGPFTDFLKISKHQIRIQHTQIGHIPTSRHSYLPRWLCNHLCSSNYQSQPTNMATPPNARPAQIWLDKTMQNSGRVHITYINSRGVHHLPAQCVGICM